MNEEELFIGGYIIRREDEETFSIENTMTTDYEPTNEVRYIAEEEFMLILDRLWKKLVG